MAAIDPATAIKTVIKLVVISLVVGWVVAYFEITPEQVLENLGETAEAVYNFVINAAEWGGKYVIIGAMIVVPVWGIATALSWLGERKRNKN